MAIITTTCPLCGAEREVEVDWNRYQKWRRRELPIQEALPTLSDSEREALKTGICDRCWNEKLGDPDENPAILNPWEVPGPAGDAARAMLEEMRGGGA